MKREAKLFQNIFNNSEICILIVDKNRNIIDANLSFCKILGYKKKELIDKSADIIHLTKSSSKQFRKIALNKVLKGKEMTLEYKLKHKSGEAIWMKLSGNIIEGEDNILWIMANITQRVKYQEELSILNDTLKDKIESQVKVLREKDKQLQYQGRLAQMGEMLNMISHQWRQPLVSISATTTYLYGKILLEDFKKDEFIEELQSIDDSTKYLSTTINDFRNFFKIDKRKVLTTFKNIVNNTFKIIKPTLINNQIEIKTVFNSSSKIFSLENEIKQVVLNILKNAEDTFIENNIKKRKIKIKTFDKNDFTFLEISDNAGGIKNEHLDKIFDAYFTTKSSKNGTGLGLYISKTIIEDNCGGEIYAKNNDKKGASFIIKLPIDK